jgi:hypothetical protein
MPPAMARIDGNQPEVVFVPIRFNRRFQQILKEPQRHLDINHDNPASRSLETYGYITARSTGRTIETKHEAGVNLQEPSTLTSRLPWRVPAI